MGTVSRDHRTCAKWQGALQFSHLERIPSYPRITESDPVLHPVPKGLKAQISIVTEVAGHAHILPPTIFDLEQLPIEREVSALRDTSAANWPNG